jgi:hypothetical protein
MPDNFNIATLFPDCAMRVRRDALPLRDVLKVENVSDYISLVLACLSYGYVAWTSGAVWCGNLERNGKNGWVRMVG